MLHTRATQGQRTQKKGAVPKLGPYRYPGYPAEKNAMIECVPSDMCDRQKRSQQELLNLKLRLMHRQSSEFRKQGLGTISEATTCREPRCDSAMCTCSTFHDAPCATLEVPGPQQPAST